MLFPLPSFAGEAFDANAYCRSLRSTSARTLVRDREREGVLVDLVLLGDEPERTPLLLELAETKCRIAGAIEASDPKGAEKSRLMGSTLFQNVVLRSPQHPAVIKLRQTPLSPAPTPASTAPTPAERIAVITKGKKDAVARMDLFQSAMLPASLADPDFAYACFQWFARPPATDSAEEQRNSRDVARKLGLEFLERHRSKEFEAKVVRTWIEVYEESRR